MVDYKKEVVGDSKRHDKDVAINKQSDINFKAFAIMF